MKNSLTQQYHKTRRNPPFLAEQGVNFEFSQQPPCAGFLRFFSNFSPFLSYIENNEKHQSIFSELNIKSHIIGRPNR